MRLPVSVVFTVFVGSAAALSAQPTSQARCESAAPLAPGLPLSSLRATGVDVGVLDSAAVSSLGGRTLSEALAARIPGLSVMRSSGGAGTGSRVHLRGRSGILVRQEPLLFIDGVRADARLHSIGLEFGGQAPSRLDDMPLDQVRCVYVLRGPAATAQYGTDASGGVIHVVTRTAAGDSARFVAHIDGGTTRDVADYPANFGSTTSCQLYRAAVGQCTIGTLRAWNPIRADSPFRIGSLAQVGGRWSAIASKWVSASIAGNSTMGDGALRNNDLHRYSIGTSTTVTPATSLVLRLQSWTLGSVAQLPPIGDSRVAAISSGLMGSSADDPVLRGYLENPRSLIQTFAVEQQLRRLGGLVDATWRPATWFETRATLGREDSRTNDETALPYSYPSNVGYSIAASTMPSTAQIREQYTSASVSMSATYGPSAFRGSTSIGGLYLTERERLETHRFVGTDRNHSRESFWQRRDGETRGLLVRQGFASSDRRFVEAGVRRDILDRQSVDFKKPTFVFANATWDVGAEPFFPRSGVVSSVRLRVAHGQSGDSRPFAELGFTSQRGFLILAPSIGDPPVERTRETEGGVNVGLFENRVAITATRFSKRTADALVAGSQAVMNGIPYYPAYNTASWQTDGVEIGGRARIIDRHAVRAELSVGYSSFDNEVTSLGLPGWLSWFSTRTLPGYPLDGLWAPEFTFADANADGVIVHGEVTASETSRFVGSSIPTRELSLAPSVVLKRSVTVAALVDRRGGFFRHNLSGGYRCAQNCRPVYDPSASLSDQAKAVDPTDAVRAWIEDASFVRLRELSVAWAMPRSLGRRIGARAASVTIAARNVGTWTNYSGLEPEGAQGGQSGYDEREFFTLPLPRTLSLRLDVSW